MKIICCHKYSQSIVLMIPKIGIIQQCLRRLEYSARFARSHPAVQKLLFRVSQKILEADGILLRFPPSTMCRQKNRYAWTCRLLCESFDLV